MPTPIATVKPLPLPGGVPLPTKLQQPLVSIHIETSSKVKSGGFFGIGSKEKVVTTANDHALPVTPHFTPDVTAKYEHYKTAPTPSTPAERHGFLMGKYGSLEAAVQGAAKASAATSFGQMMAVIEGKKGVFSVAPIGGFYRDRDYYGTWSRPEESTPFSNPTVWGNDYAGRSKVLSQSSEVTSVTPLQDIVKAIVLADRWFDLRQGAAAVSNATEIAV